MNYKKYIVSLIWLSILLNSSQSICNSTAVQLYNGGAPLAASGTYFLSQDIAGALTISGNNITLDLNGHQIGGLTIGSGLSNIFVSNGVIDGGVLIGVSTESNTSNVHLSDLVIQNAMLDGIFIIKASELFISRVLVKDCSRVGLRIGTSNKRIFISDSEFSHNGTGITIGNLVSDLVIRDCQANKNVVFGTFVGAGNQMYFIRFIVNANMQDGINATISPTTPVSFACFDCTFTKNTGLGINPARTLFVLKGCLAENNTTGFAQVNTEAGIITQCVSNNNSSSGFKDANFVTACRYTSNYAFNNSINYNAPGTPFDPIGPFAPDTQFWRNVDGDL